MSVGEAWRVDGRGEVELKDVVHLAFHECFERRQSLPLAP
jgi:hypothetical protein